MLNTPLLNYQTLERIRTQGTDRGPHGTNFTQVMVPGIRFYLKKDTFVHEYDSTTSTRPFPVQIQFVRGTSVTDEASLLLPPSRLLLRCRECRVCGRDTATRGLE